MKIPVADLGSRMLGILRGQNHEAPDAWETDNEIEASFCDPVSARHIPLRFRDGSRCSIELASGTETRGVFPGWRSLPHAYPGLLSCRPFGTQRQAFAHARSNGQLGRFAGNPSPQSLKNFTLEVDAVKNSGYAEGQGGWAPCSPV
jgi:hypothetical protein